MARMTTLYDLSGGRDRLHAMTAAFYAKVIEDDLLGPMFSRGAADHATWLADWMCVSFGGPRDYLVERGDLAFVIMKHAELFATEAQRARWASHMMAAADEVGMPPEFVRPFSRYVDAISRSVRDQSNMPRARLAAMLGVPPETGREPREA